jgi:hypothetical protein
MGSDKTCDPKDETIMSAMDQFFRYYLDATGCMLVVVHTTYSPDLTHWTLPEQPGKRLRWFEETGSFHATPEYPT